MLPAAVGDAVAWQTGVERGLEVLKRAVHGGVLGDILDGAVARQAGEVRAAWPELAEVVDALAWTRIGDPAALRKDLRWLDGAGAELTEVRRRAELTTVISLVRLADEEGSKRVAPLIEVLGDSRIHDTAIEGTAYASAVLQRIADPQLEVPAERPSGKLGPALLALPAWLLARPSEVRRGALRALAAADLCDTAARWAALWTAVDRELAFREQRTWNEVTTSYDALKQAIHRAPPALVSRGLVEAIQHAATRPKLVEVVERLPEAHHAMSRASALVWLASSRDALAPAEEAAYLEVLRDHLAAGGARPARTWLAPVEELIDPSGRSTLARISNALTTPARWREFGRALGLAARAERTGLDAAALENLAALVRAGTAEDAVAALRLLRPRQRGIDAITADAASKLAMTPGQLVEMAELLGSVTDAAPASVVTVAAACGPGGADLVRALLLRGERARIIEAASQLGLADALKLRRRPMLVMPDGDVPPWATALPEALSTPLARLCAAGGEAQARKLLGDTYPDVDALDAEIAAIERKLAGADGEPARRLQARLTNLEHKRDYPKPPTREKVAHLEKALTEAAELTAFERWRDALAARIDAAIPAALELDAAPPWLATPAIRQVVLGILELKGSHRKLAHRVLAARCGPPPWDLRDAPANHAFVTRLRRAGIDPAPWVDGIGAMRVGDGDGALDLALEDDPLEVLRMGAHYETCLAPGAINFFAAVVNAADLNKRVIYGRGADGAVVGRCLLALTDSGGILAFHPYCHDDRDFTAMVKAFVQALAARMNTVVLPTGAVSTLLDSRWYDDGPEDLTGQFTFLDEDSAFRTALTHLASDAVIPLLTSTFAPLPLGGHTLGLIIGLSELDERPALIVPLMPLLDQLTDVPLELRLRAAALAIRAGRADLAAPRLGRDLETHARALQRQHRHVGRELLDRLVDASASRALAFLRDTRERGVRDYLGERDPTRLWTAARAHELLGRKRAAAALYRALASLHAGMRAECEQRLAALA